MNNTLFNFTTYHLPEVIDADFSFFGNNQKGILIAYYHENEASFEYLQRILSAVKIKPEEDCLLLKINIGCPLLLHLHKIKSEKNFTKAIFFGIKPHELGLQIELPKQQQAIKFQDTDILFTDDLAEIQKLSITLRALLRDNLKLLVDML